MDDLISRKDAIDEIDEWIKAFRENGHKESAADACLIQDGIIQLPSAQPVGTSLHDSGTDYAHGYVDGYKRGMAESEITQCKDCKYWDIEIPHLYKNNEELHNCACAMWLTKASDYCAWAERREE